MQSIGTNDIDFQPATKLPLTFIIGRAEELPFGSRKTVEFPNEREIALYNIDGEFYAIENSWFPFTIRESKSSSHS